MRALSPIKQQLRLNKAFIKLLKPRCMVFRRAMYKLAKGARRRDGRCIMAGAPGCGVGSAGV